MKAKDLKIGGKYNWINQSEWRIYIGNLGSWLQFEKVDEPGVVWCEVRESDLHMIEETKGSIVNVADQCRVKVNDWHLVTNIKRAKVLRKRGEFIKWSQEYNCWIWDFNNRTTKEVLK